MHNFLHMQSSGVFPLRTATIHDWTDSAKKTANLAKQNSLTSLFNNPCVFGAVQK